MEPDIQSIEREMVQRKKKEEEVRKILFPFIDNRLDDFEREDPKRVTSQHRKQMIRIVFDMFIDGKRTYQSEKHLERDFLEEIEQLELSQSNNREELQKKQDEVSSYIKENGIDPSMQEFIDSMKGSTNLEMICKEFREYYENSNISLTVTDRDRIPRIIHEMGKTYAELKKTDETIIEKKGELDSLRERTREVSRQVEENPLAPFLERYPILFPEMKKEVQIIQQGIYDPVL